MYKLQSFHVSKFIFKFEVGWNPNYVPRLLKFSSYYILLSANINKLQRVVFPGEKMPTD